MSRRRARSEGLAESAANRAKALVLELNRLANPENVEGMKRFGIRPANALGIAMPALRRIGRDHKRDHDVALLLWDSGLHEARILASIVADPARTTPEMMDEWVSGFDTWDVCDQCCMNLFEKTPHAWAKAAEWSRREREFEKRAGLALIACLAWHQKDAPDGWFLRLMSAVRRGARDERNYVWKAASWALRQIGKRGGALRDVALAEATRMAACETASERRVGRETIRDLS